MPSEVAVAVDRVVALVLPARIGIHVHNDAGVAVANMLASVEHGATPVEGTINGCGERCGNANLCSVLLNLEAKLGRTCLPEGNLRLLSGVSRLAS